jgi:flavin reductase (DIM6/NTAB) family NADH-FMN oxidoreductase RutF
MGQRSTGDSVTFDSLQFRRALGRFATGVCVITANPPGYRPFGLTVNSFASLSLTPPLVLWSLQKSSDTMEAFGVATQYCVNVLAAQQQALSGRFARKAQHELADEDFVSGDAGLPVLNGALASFECDIDARHDGGDHVILVGRVLAMRASPEGLPLCYYDGGYRELR